MAAPYVTGAIALMLAKNNQLGPQQIKNILLKTAQKKLQLADTCVAGGILNINQALENIK